MRLARWSPKDVADFTFLFIVTISACLMGGVFLAVSMLSPSSL